MIRPKEKEIDEMWDHLVSARVEDKHLMVVDALISMWVEGKEVAGEENNL
jgi:hypothetical protein